MDDSGKPPWNGGWMKPLRTRLQEMRQRSGLPWEVLERDYLLSWILAGISRRPGIFRYPGSTPGRLKIGAGSGPAPVTTTTFGGSSTPTVINWTSRISRHSSPRNARSGMSRSRVPGVSSRRPCSRRSKKHGSSGSVRWSRNSLPARWLLKDFAPRSPRYYRKGATRKGATALGRNPLIYLVAGPGFEPGTFGIIT